MVEEIKNSCAERLIVYDLKYLVQKKIACLKRVGPKTTQAVNSFTIFLCCVLKILYADYAIVYLYDTSAR